MFPLTDSGDYEQSLIAQVPDNLISPLPFPYEYPTELPYLATQSTRARQSANPRHNWSCLGVSDQDCVIDLSTITQFQTDDDILDYSSKDPLLEVEYSDSQEHIFNGNSRLLPPTFPLSNDISYITSPSSWTEQSYPESINITNEPFSPESWEDMSGFQSEFSSPTYILGSGLQAPFINSQSIPMSESYIDSTSLTDDEASQSWRLPAYPALDKRRIPPVRPSKPSIEEGTDLSHRCPSCWRLFKLKKDLMRHERSVHGNSSSKWFCPVQGCKRCTLGFNRKDKFIQHIRTHGSSFDDNPDLNQLASSCYHSKPQ